MSGKSLLYGDPIDEDTIRVLEVKSSKTFNSQVQCNLVAYPRSRCRPYEALSYCWGTEDLGFECVLVDGQEIQAGKPLATALHYLRLTDETRYMWVDAICINQGSNEEKSNQVKRMDATYEHAAFVLVWLGEPSESTKTHLAMKAIGRLGSQYKDQALQDVHDQQLLLPEVEGCGPSVYLPAIRQILQRDWFRRLWVIQEVCLAPENSVKMYCGFDCIDFWQLSNAQLAMLQPEHWHLNDKEQKLLLENRPGFAPPGYEPPLVSTRQLFATSRADYEKIEQARNTTCTLLRHLWTFRNRNCTDPRDRIYALRSLAMDLKEAVVPNYGESHSRIYAKVTRQIIEHHKNLDVLGMCFTFEGSDPGDAERPSWAPDFHVTTTQRPFTSLTMFLGGHEPYYLATTRASEARPSSSDDEAELKLWGYDGGVVTALGIEDAKTLEEYIIKSRDLAETISHTSFDSGMDRTEAFWRTLIANRTSENRPARADVEGKQFRAWWDTWMDKVPHALEDFVKYNSAFLQHSSRRSFFTTSHGHIGLGPIATKLGDHISLLAGSQVPFILRKVEEKFHVVGEAYVHELMDGRYWEKKRAERVPLTEVVLI